MRTLLPYLAFSGGILGASAAFAQSGRGVPYRPTERVRVERVSPVEPLVRAGGRQGAPGLVEGREGHFDAPGFIDSAGVESWHDGWLGDNPNLHNPFIENSPSSAGESYFGRGSRDRSRVRERDRYDDRGRRL